MNTSPTRVIVDLNAYAQNIEFVRRYLDDGCGIIAIIKANAYGHGLVPIAKKAVASNVAMLGVATVDEAIELREAGITAPILVLVQPMADALGAAVEYDLRLMISDVSAAERLGEISQKAKKVAPIHCKVDSGMGRQGFELEQAVRDLLYLTRISHIDIEGIATHFPVADLRDDPFTMNQIRSFKHFLKQLDKGGVPYEMVHAANSAAIVNHKPSRFNMVRPGLMTYGVWPTATPTPSSPLEPVLRWETRVVMVKEFEPGSSIGYGRTYTTNDRMRGAIIPVGYGDGYKHSLSNTGEVLIRGKRCPIRGSVCMDQMVVDVTGMEAAANDLVTLIGRDGQEAITIEELARHAQTIPYDILTSIGSRVRREYVE
jgi:alanine racemase